MSLIIYYAILAYFTVSVCKFILVMPSIPIAIAVASWHITRKKGVIVPAVIFTIPFYWLLVCTFWWVPTLISEKARFFFAYRKHDIIRDALYAYQTVHSQRK